MENSDISEQGEQLELIEVPTKPESAMKVLTITFVVVMFGIGIIYLVSSSLTKSADIPNLNLSTSQQNPQQQQQSQQQVAGAAAGPQGHPTIAPTHSASSGQAEIPTPTPVKSGPTATTAPGATATPTPNPTATPEPTATLTPTETPTPSVEPTDSPTPSPTDTP